MINSIHAEFRKLFSVRSTYVNFLFCVAIIILFAGIINGFKISDKANLVDPHFLEREASNAIVFVGLLFAFVGLLLAGHEYRFNTIMYSLTNVNRRWKLLVAKFIAISVAAVIFSVFVALFTPLCDLVGLHLHGHGVHLVPQTFDYWSVIWHCAYVGWGYSMYAFVLMLILRNQVGAIVTFLLLPLIGENIIALLLKSNSKYLPFQSLQNVVLNAGENAQKIAVSTGFSLRVSLMYIVIGLIVGFVLFVRRDAN